MLLLLQDKLYLRQLVSVHPLLIVVNKNYIPFHEGPCNSCLSLLMLETVDLLKLFDCFKTTAGLVTAAPFCSRR